MNSHARRPIAFPPINCHGVIGDRRTGALVAADGTLNWFCVPYFDGTPIFGGLLDPERGGFCRFGPAQSQLGRQHYLPESVAVVTTWSNDVRDGFIELTDVMAWPGNERDASRLDSRVIIRRLRTRGAAGIWFELCPRWGFLARPEEIRSTLGGVIFRFGNGELAVWASFPLRIEGDAAQADLETLDDMLWVVIGWNSQLENWSLKQTVDLFDGALRYWREWNASLTVDAAESLRPGLRRSAMTVHLLTHAEYGCSVAALTTSLPERLGGDRNYDYRFAWVRDASLSLAFLARLGKTDEVLCYLDWLCGLKSCTNSPLQVCYRLDGNIRLDEIELSAVRGYADSRPCRYGNRAAKQRQIGSLAFFADCARIYVENGGTWEEKHWHLLKRVANYTYEHWHLPDNGIWELPVEAHYVSSKVLSWVVLERTALIAKLTGRNEEKDLARWTTMAEEIHAEVLSRGWSERQNSFVQRYDWEALDAAALLIPLMEFLPPEDPKIGGTLAAIEQKLVIDGLVHRFEPSATLGGAQLLVGDYEGAFLPATFWYAHALAKCGRVDQAEAVVARCESIAGELGLFAEEADAREQTFLGSMPLLFAHVEYARATREIAEAHKRNRSVKLKR
jgi:GH15 family glucan-1,4-alpha-glucosidase